MQNKKKNYFLSFFSMLNYVNMIYFEKIGHMQMKALKCIFGEKKIFCSF
jgi:hypothetical protein